jgi:hypothetical protein
MNDRRLVWPWTITAIVALAVIYVISFGLAINGAAIGVQWARRPAKS